MAFPCCVLGNITQGPETSWLHSLQMDPETKALTPVDYLGVKCVSFGFAGQGSAIMRGPMVSGLIQQLVMSAKWGELDYLVVDFPPGTGLLCKHEQYQINAFAWSILRTINR